MPSKEPVALYRPVRIDDGEGGYTEATGLPTTIWGKVAVHDGETVLEDVDIGEDVRVDDVLVVQE